MPKKNDDSATSKTEPVKVTVKPAEPAKIEATEAATPIVAARKIITVSHDSDEDEPAPATEAAPAEPATRIIKKNRIEPLSAPEGAEDPAPKAEAAAASKTEAVDPAAGKPSEAEAAPASIKVEPKLADAEKSEEKPDEKPAEETEETETPPAESGFTLDEGDEGQHPMDEAQSEADKAAAAKQEAVNKLVADETYFLPINSVEKRRAKHMLWVTLLLFIVLGVAAAAWASSGGYVTIPGL